MREHGTPDKFREEIDEILADTNEKIDDGKASQTDDGQAGRAAAADEVAAAEYFGDPFDEDDKTPRPAPTGPGDGPGGESLMGAAKTAGESMKLTAVPVFANPAMAVMLEKIRIGLKSYVSPAVLDQMKFEQDYDPFTDRVMMELGMYLFSNKIHTETTKADFPAGWFQSFKETFYPDWLKSKFPVKYTQVFTEVKTVHVCPHLNYRTRDEEKYHLQFLIPEGDLTRYYG